MKTLALMMLLGLALLGSGCAVCGEPPPAQRNPPAVARLDPATLQEEIERSIVLFEEVVQVHASSPAEPTTSLQLLDMTIRLAHPLRPVGQPRSELEKRWARQELRLLRDGKNGSTVLITYVLPPVARFYTPRTVTNGGESTRSFWDVVRQAAGKYPSEAASLEMFLPVEKEARKKATLSGEALHFLAARCHIRRVLLGPEARPLVVRSEHCTAYMYRNTSHEGRGLSLGHVFDADGRFRGELTVHAPAEVLEQEELALIREVVGGISFRL